MADVDIGVGDDERVAVLIRGERGGTRDQRRQIARGLGGIDPAQRDDLHDQLRVHGNLLRIIAGADGDVLLLRFVLGADDQATPLHAGAVAVFIECLVEQLHGLLARDRLRTPHIHGAADGCFEDDNETGGVAHVVEHRLERGAAEIEAQLGGFGRGARGRRPRARIRRSGLHRRRPGGGSDILS